MKPFLKAIFFLALLTILDYLLRKGFVGFLIPFKLPQNVTVLFLFALFAVFSWLITKWFSKTDKITLHDLGISFNTRNRFEFFYGFLIGAGLWAIVSFVQSVSADFSWILRPDINLLKIFYGLIFIFIADLGTELYTRGYPLTKFKDNFGAITAMIIMVFFVGLKSYSFDLQGELLFYTMLIPALHTVFFSIIYFKTKRLGAALGVHTGANFVTISIFDLRIEQPGQAIPSGIFQPNVELETLSLTALQLPWIFMALIFSIAVYFWWIKKHINLKKLLTIALLTTIFVGCNQATKQSNTMADKTIQTDNTLTPSDTTPKVTGIGGIFFFSENPEKTKEWYSKNLGLEVNQWGSSFEFRNANRADEINYLQWSPFKQGSEYFAPSKKEFMINYRVQNIEGLVKKLKENGETIVDTIETFEYGKFVHIMDADGNKIELWEPVDSTFTAMGGKTTK